MKNTLHVIGEIPDKYCYLNINLKSALDKYHTIQEKMYGKVDFKEMVQELQDSQKIQTFEFEEEFGAYDVWETGN